VAKKKFTNFCVDISLAMSTNERDLSFDPFAQYKKSREHIIDPSWIAIGEH
jgi:hypothetical protein